MTQKQVMHSIILVIGITALLFLIIGLRSEGPVQEGASSVIEEVIEAPEVEQEVLEFYKG